MNETLTSKIVAYRPSPEVIAAISTQKILLLTGITAAGKNTIMKHLNSSGDFYDIVTCTTRMPRENSGVLETNGVEYHFIDFDTVEKMAEEKQFIEVKKVHSNVYGTGISEFQKAAEANKIAIADVDVQGADEFLDLNLQNLQVLFVVPPSFEIWIERLKGRYGGTLEGQREDIMKRFISAKAEIAHVLTDPRYTPVMNADSADSAVSIRQLLAGKKQTPEETTFARDCLQNISRGLDDHIAMLQ